VPPAAFFEPTGVRRERRRGSIAANLGVRAFPSRGIEVSRKAAWLTRSDRPGFF
jgi:hypothetical protein